MAKGLTSYIFSVWKNIIVTFANVQADTALCWCWSCNLVGLLHWDWSLSSTGLLLRCCHCLLKHQREFLTTISNTSKNKAKLGMGRFSENLVIKAYGTSANRISSSSASSSTTPRSTSSSSSLCGSSASADSSSSRSAAESGSWAASGWRFAAAIISNAASAVSVRGARLRSGKGWRLTGASTWNFKRLISARGWNHIVNKQRVIPVALNTCGADAGCSSSAADIWKKKNLQDTRWSETY